MGFFLHACMVCMNICMYVYVCKYVCVGVYRSKVEILDHSPISLSGQGLSLNLEVINSG